jgi:hypothetical protein
MGSKSTKFSSEDFSEKYQQLRWQNSPVPSQSEKQVKAILKDIPGFHRLNKNEMTEMYDLSSEYGMNIRQVMSLRSGILREKAMIRHKVAVELTPTLGSLYNEGSSAVDLATDYDLPPGTVMRMILSSRGWKKDKIRIKLNKEVNTLNERDGEEWKLVRQNDMITAGDDKARRIMGDNFETRVATYFDSQCVGYRTQDELMEEQVAKFGRPIRTPDLLLDDPIIVNGKKISWIDAKGFYGADIWSNRKSFKKQTNRYFSEWGRGALLFKDSFCDGLFVRGALLLDASSMF